VVWYQYRCEGQNNEGYTVQSEQLCICAYCAVRTVVYRVYQQPTLIYVAFIDACVSVQTIASSSVLCVVLFYSILSMLSTVIVLAVYCCTHYDSYVYCCVSSVILIHSFVRFLCSVVTYPTVVVFMLHALASKCADQWRAYVRVLPNAI
jgi:hypothetical protein